MARRLIWVQVPGLVCDACVLHHLLFGCYTPLMAFYVTSYEVFSWLSFAVLVLSILSLSGACSKVRAGVGGDLASDKFVRGMSELEGACRWWFWLNELPMVFIVGWIGDKSLFTAWVCVLVAGRVLRSQAKYYVFLRETVPIRITKGN